MPTLQIQIAADTDDGYYEDSPGPACWRQSNSVRFGHSAPAAVYHAIFRFEGVVLDNSHKITSAKLYLKAASNFNVVLDIRLGCNDVADADNLAVQCDASGRVMTAHFTEWLAEAQVGNDWYYSPDFSTALQEVIDRGDWVSGNAIAVLLVQQNPAGSYATAWSFHSAPADAAYLEVEYQDSSGGAMM